MKHIKKILVTTNKESFEKLEQWCNAQGITVWFESFIKIDAVLDLLIPTTDWVFFSSPKGAKSYLENYTIKAKKIAVFGKGTLRELHKFNLSAHFVGKVNQTPKEIAIDFKQLIGSTATVFFPIGQLSKKSIQNEINSAQITNLITYKTVYLSKKLDTEFDVILFTSPSNFNGYKLQHKLNGKTKLIALGKTTAAAINKFSKCIVLKEPNEASFIEELQQ